MQFFLRTIGSFLIMTELACLELCVLACLLTIGAFFFFQLEHFSYSWSSLLTMGKVRPRSNSMDCRQRSLTVSKEAPTLNKKELPAYFLTFQGNPPARNQYINNLPGILPVFARVRNPGATCRRTEMNSLKNLADMIPQKYFPVFARVRIQAPHVFVQKLNS